MKKRRGATLVEVMVGSALTALVLLGTLATLYAGTRSWVLGQSLIDAEVDGSQAIRSLSLELREAMAVTVATDGQSLTYRMPRRNAAGDFVVPAEWDGVNRRAILAANASGRFTLSIGVAGSERALTRNLILVDPDMPGTPTYRVFTAGPGRITREIQIMVITRTNGPRGEPVYHRVRETLFLRNIPSITQ